MKKIIITGNSGKTAFAYFLAEQLSKTKKVVLVSTDENKGIYRCLFPTSKRSKKSLARLLSDPVITDKDIYNNAHLVNKRLLMISNVDTTESFPEVTAINCAKLLMGLENIADVLIVDSSKHLFDTFILNAPMTQNIAVTTADMRGFHHRMKQKNADIHVLWENSAYATYQDAANTFKEKPFEVPFIKKLSSLYNGVSIKDISLPRKYSKTLIAIVKRMEELEGKDGLPTFTD